MKYRLTESRLLGMIQGAVKSVLKEEMTPGIDYGDES